MGDSPESGASDTVFRIQNVLAMFQADEDVLVLFEDLGQETGTVFDPDVLRDFSSEHLDVHPVVGIGVIVDHTVIIN